MKEKGRLYDVWLCKWPADVLLLWWVTFHTSSSWLVYWMRRIQCRERFVATLAPVMVIPITGFEDFSQSLFSVALTVFSLDSFKEMKPTPWNGSSLFQDLWLILHYVLCT